MLGAHPRHPASICATKKQGVCGASCAQLVKGTIWWKKIFLRFISAFLGSSPVGIILNSASTNQPSSEEEGE